MSQERLVGLSSMSIKFPVFEDVDFDSIVTEFANKIARKEIFSTSMVVTSNNMYSPEDAPNTGFKTLRILPPLLTKLPPEDLELLIEANRGSLHNINSEANARRISMVEGCFGSSGSPLAVPGRVLVGEGVLTKMCRKKPKPRQFFLFNDILVYGNIVINKKKYNKQHIIPLEEVKLESLEDEGQCQNGWLICTTSKSFAVYAATSTEKHEWMAHINKCIEDLLRKSGKKAAEIHAAVWVPDSEASVCMHCKKNHFTVLNRRHHCRKCGAVVCGPCSNKKIMLPNQSTKPLRVCLQCYDSLSKSKFQSTCDNRPLMPSDMKGRNISGDSSGDEDSDDDYEPNRNEGTPDQTKFYHSPERVEQIPEK